MCTFEILSPIIDIANYFVPRWHVSSTCCNFLVFGVKMMSVILAIYHRELFPFTSCLLTIGTHFCGRIYWSSLHWLLPFICLFSCQGLYQLPLSSIPLVDLVFSWSCLVFSRYSESGDPTSCICIQMQILYNALVLGELSYFL